MDLGSAKGVTVQQTGPAQGKLGGSGFIAQEPRSPGQTPKQPGLEPMAAEPSSSFLTILLHKHAPAGPGLPGKAPG